MTIFSAGTFVVWGGIAFRLGMVAVSLLVTTGISIALVGILVAGRWHNTGITTPSEFMRLRFNEATVQVYTWLGMLFRGIGMSVGLYALAVMLAVLVPLPEGAPFRDPHTGNLSVSWGILLWGTVVVVYTMIGGLWAVLMIDVILCMILCLVVLVAVPLSLNAVGGAGAFVANSPEGFLMPASAEYSFGFLGLWLLIGFFRYASDWAFVQRYICVPTAADAKKATYLMGALFIVSPIVWMLPAMAYRVLDPGASPERAYILMCQHVLPNGMLGMMVAAMFSSTASTVSGQLNVFAAAFTCDVYRARFAPAASERHVVIVGRLATALYGALTICAALLVPLVGGAENVILTMITLLLGPMMLPPIWGLFSKRIGHNSVWVTLAVCAAAAGLVKLGPFLEPYIPRCGRAAVAALAWTGENPRVTEGMIGMTLPLVVLCVLEYLARRRPIDPGWLRLAAAFRKQGCQARAKSRSRLPIQLVGASAGMLGAVMVLVAIQTQRQRLTLLFFAGMLLAIAAALAWLSCRAARRPEEGTQDCYKSP